MNHKHEEHEAPHNFWASRYAIGLIVFGAVTGYFLLTEHLAHTVGALPFLLLLACPLMHIFMHHGHCNHDDQDSRPGDNSAEAGPVQPKPGEPS
jgi:hypothetical protein